ncbi:MAG: DNA starvation/stationary phase protection protein [Rhodospirillales bacterium]|nr:DNA starvation/stationary phase protection protein [Rhodospirillales bacterium]
MTSNVEMTKQAKKECANAMSKVLADTYILYLKTHNFHWNVTGPMFKSLHEMFEEQYTEMWTAVDEIAERIRALGAAAPGTYAKFRELGTVEETEDLPNADEMVADLVKSNEALARTIRSALSTAQDNGDEVSAGILTDRLTVHEKSIWMMRSTLAA